MAWRLSHVFPATALAIIASSFAAPAMAAPVVYNFSTTAGPLQTGSPVVALLGASASVSGSFTYDASAPFTVLSQDLGYDAGLAVHAGALLGISGTVAGFSFSDTTGGAASVGNEVPAFGGDLLNLNADPSPRAGQNTTPTGPNFPRQLVGFEVGAYTLHNVRLYWAEAIPGTADFLSASTLPGTLPAFQGRLALDFIRTADPANTANVPYAALTVYFNGLTVQAAPVPEPSTAAMMLAGAGVMAAVAARRRKA